MSGLRYIRDVRQSVRNKITNNEFVPLTEIVQGTSSDSNINRQIEMNSREYLAQNVPPPAKVQTKLDLFRYLFLFANYFLQLYPEKTISFFDYMLFLMDQAGRLNVAGLARLDHLMRQDFAANPDWNWSQTRAESMSSTQRVAFDPQYLLRNPEFNMGNKGKGKASTSSHWSGFKNGKGKGKGKENNFQVKKDEKIIY